MFERIRRLLGLPERAAAPNAVAAGEWEQAWNARQRALEELLGPAEPGVLHSPIPLHLGGNADVLVFRGYVDGYAYVTADLTGPESPQRLNDLGNYELMVCTRTPEPFAPALVSRLAPYTLQAVLDPCDTMEIGPIGEGSAIDSLLFLPPERIRGEFDLDGQRCGLLLCVGVTSSEVTAFRREYRAADLPELLRREGVLPYTDLHRPAVA